MTYRIVGGIFLVLLGVSITGFANVNQTLLGTLGIIAGIALVAGL